MESVEDVKGSIEASLDALKPGGDLIFSVPNNESFIKDCTGSVLNLPPHHKSLWDESSLASLQNFFPMDLVGFQKEPLQTYHYPVIANNWIDKTIGTNLLGKAIKRLSKWTRAYNLVAFWKDSIEGHSIIAHYTKKA
jgi:hypothetical protein